MAQSSSNADRVPPVVGELHHSAVSFDISTTGGEVVRFFESHPDAPGIILTKANLQVGALSQTVLLRTISRPFGAELFYRRPIQAVVECSQCGPMLVLPWDCTIEDAVCRCLERDSRDLFEPFLVQNEFHGILHIVDFRTLLLASSEGFAIRNQQLAEEMKERKMLEQKLLRAQRMESIGLLAGGVAHNLNNTLGPIMMAASLLDSDLPRESHDEYVTTIKDAVKRAADIILEMLVFSRGMEGDRLVFQPHKLIGETERFVKMTFPKSIAFSTCLAEDLWNVTGDQTQIHQVLLNLCVNARDAMPDGGRLKLSVENCEVDENFDALPPDAKAGCFVRFSITDTGTGIPPNIIEKIFDPFFTTKGISKGSGLGLSTVVGIIKSHGGFVMVDSQMGEGSSFSVFLPATQQPVHHSLKETQPAVSQGNGELILIVDDEAPIRVMAETILRKNGYDVVAAADGNDALATYECQKQKINLVLTDLSMPGMDGVALSRALKGLNPALKIIASSGQVEKSHKSELEDLGVYGFLTKPYRQDQLLTIVHEEICGLARL